MRDGFADASMPELTDEVLLLAFAVLLDREALQPRVVAGGVVDEADGRDERLDDVDLL